jgi:pyridoxine 4-dehydrogenase
VAVAWLLHRSPNMLLISGTASIKHLRENLGAAQLAIADDIMIELDAVGRGSVR